MKFIRAKNCCKGMVTIPITNMVCPRCIMAVEAVLNDMGVTYSQVKLGAVLLPEGFSPDRLRKFENRLSELGFSIAKSRDMVWVETVKFTLIQLFDNESLELNVPLSILLSEKVNADYSRLSQLFSNSQGKTIEQYFIDLKIEKAKEWLSLELYNISQIAWKLGYGSVQYFSAQFKKVTGQTPSEYKKSSKKDRKSLDSLGSNKADNFLE
ncbi:helix-turn-helix domain-containing protein [Cyclobacterium marinum]|nr:AraC family transcriptional regulator [Cyclobacterium marinum]MBI0399243.1 helix-turn-helix transcriptional regulator [Cyclobacterium marinum]